MADLYSEDELEEMIEEATVDAYDESEQRVGFYTMLDENLKFPFKAKIVGETVSIDKLDMDSEDRILAVCKRNGREYKVDLLDLEIDKRKTTGCEWIAAYRERGRHV